MPDNLEPERQEYSKNDNPPPVVTPTTDSSSQTINTTSEKSADNKGKEDNKKETLPERQQERWSNSDKINLWLAIFTAGLFVITFYSTKISNSALQEAIDTDKANRIKDSIAGYNDSVRTNNDTIHNRLVLEEQEKLVKEYVDQIQETKSEFEKLNQPYLQAVNVAIDQPISFNHHIEFSADLLDLSQIPVKILRKVDYMGFLGNAPTMKQIRDSMSDDLNNVNKYIFISYALHDKATLSEYYDQEMIELMGEKGLFWYFGSEIEYENLITHVKRYYFYICKLKLQGDSTTYYEYIYNENSTMKRLLK